MADIKKVVRNIYKFDFSKTTLIDGNEIMATDYSSEFVDNFRKRDLDNGIIVTPVGYRRGLVYKYTNGGEFYNNPEWDANLITFSLDIFGLKNKAFYRITVKGRNTHRYRVTDYTEDRSLIVSDSNQELLLKENLENTDNNTDFSAIFRATSNEINLYFTIGKIFVNDIIIDEIELMNDNTEVEDIKDDILAEGKLSIAAYGIYEPQPVINDTSSFKGRYLEMTKLAGKGLILFYDTKTSSFVLERDNANDILGASFTNINYIVDINTEKLCGCSGHYAKDIDVDISPNTIKQGYINYIFLNSKNEAGSYKDFSGRLIVLVYKLS